MKNSYPRAVIVLLGSIAIAFMLMPYIAFAECRVVDYGDRAEVECDGPPMGDEERKALEKLQEDKSRETKNNEVKFLYSKCTAGLSTRLKSPASAQFQLTDPNSPIEIVNGFRVVKIAVDAQNGYGALIRDYFECGFDNLDTIIWVGKDQHPNIYK